MAFDAFIKIDGIEGESTDDQHQSWIEVLHHQMGITQKVSTTASSAGGGTTGRATFQDLSFTKLLDKATPKLALACADGTHIDKIVPEVCRAGTDKVKFMTFELSNCIISKVLMESGGSLPFENVGITYGRVQWCYTLQIRAGGGAAGNVATGWDLQRNCKA
jgi:type VI secretion system secreted protein Hcp